MTEEQPSSDELVPGDRPVSEAERTELAEEASEPLEEPQAPARFSPYSIAAFVVSLYSLSQSQVAFSAFAQLSFRTSIVAAIPVGLAAIGLWLAAQADEEIFVSDGRFGGVGFARAARVIAAFTLVFVALVFFVSRFTENTGGINFG